MEVVLLWLDDLDDFVYSLAAIWHSVCRCALCVGLTAAMVLTPLFSMQLSELTVAVCSAVALGSVCAWIAAVATRGRRARHSLSTTA